MSPFKGKGPGTGRGANEASSPQAQSQNLVATQAQKKKSLSNKEREEYKMLSSEIERLEIRKEEINLVLSLGTLDHVAIKTLSTELAKLVTKLGEYEERWFELEERV